MSRRALSSLPYNLRQKAIDSMLSGVPDTNVGNMFKDRLRLHAADIETPIYRLYTSSAPIVMPTDPSDMPSEDIELAMMNVRSDRIPDTMEAAAAMGKAIKGIFDWMGPQTPEEARHIVKWMDDVKEAAQNLMAALYAARQLTGEDFCCSENYSSRCCAGHSMQSSVSYLMDCLETVTDNKGFNDEDSYMGTVAVFPTGSRYTNLTNTMVWGKHVEHHPGFLSYSVKSAKSTLSDQGLSSKESIESQIAIMEYAIDIDNPSQKELNAVRRGSMRCYVYGT